MERAVRMRGDLRIGAADLGTVPVMENGILDGLSIDECDQQPGGDRRACSRPLDSHTSRRCASRCIRGREAIRASDSKTHTIVSVIRRS